MALPRHQLSRLSSEVQLPILAPNVYNGNVESGMEPEVYTQPAMPEPQPPSGPQHPIPSMQQAFAESLVEATQQQTLGKPRLRTGDDKARREELLDGERLDPPPTALWRRRPGQVTHELCRLMAQISFGVYLLLNGMANDQPLVIFILQGHINEVDEFLETTLEDMNLATRDMEERIKHLKLPMDNIAVFERMLEDPTFRMQIMDGNQKIEHILARTQVALQQMIEDVSEGLTATREFTIYLRQQERGSWKKERPDVLDIFGAMKGNTDGWSNAFEELEAKSSSLDATIARLTDIVSEMDRRVSEVDRKAWEPLEEEREDEPRPQSLMVTSRSPPPESLSELSGEDTPAEELSVVGYLTEQLPVENPAEELAEESSKELVKESDGGSVEQSVEKAAGEAVGTPFEKPAGEEKLVEEPPMPKVVEINRDSKPPPRLSERPVSRQVSRPDPAQAPELVIPQDPEVVPMPRTSLRQRVSLRRDLPQSIQVPPPSIEIQPRLRTIQRTSQAPDSAYASDMERPPVHSMASIGSSLAEFPMPFVQPGMIPSPHSERQFFRPVQASPYSPLQQRPHTSGTVGPHHFPAPPRNTPSAMGMSMMSNGTATSGRTAGGKSVKKKRSAFGWLKKAFSLDEEERAAFEQRRTEQMANPYYEAKSQQFLDGRRIRPHHLSDLDRHVQLLESKVNQLRASLTHWQQWYLEYSALKEEVEQLPTDPLPLEQLRRIRRDFESKILTKKEINEIMGKNDIKDPTNIVTVLSRRMDYVEKNIDSLTKLLEKEENKLAAASVVAHPDAGTDEESGLPITDIIEELDEDDNVVRSRLRSGADTEPKIIEALKKVGIQEEDLPETEAELPKVQETISNQAQATEVPPPNAAATTSSVQKIAAPDAPTPKKSVSFAEDTKPGDNTTEPPKSWAAQHLERIMQQAREQEAMDMSSAVIPDNEASEDSQLRREMLQYSMSEIGPVVAELQLEDDYSDEDDDMDWDGIEDEEESTDNDDEDDLGRSKRSVINSDYMKRMQELEKRLGVQSAFTVKPSETKPQKTDEGIGRISVVAGDSNSSASTAAPPTSAPKERKSVSFASKLDIAPEPSAQPPMNSKLKERKIAEVGDIVEKTTEPEMVAEPEELPKRVSRFKKERASVASPSASTSIALPPGPHQIPASFLPPRVDVPVEPTPPEHQTLATEVFERPVAASVEEPDEMNDQLLYQAAAVEYNRLRNQMIQKQGGFVQQDGALDSETGLVPLDEELGGPKRLSKFKAARLAKLQ
ncbi:hypothetical protein N0V88_004642 [Collariella sp. IMI 366227]|nr:hypothetical protein N0V88_004642 [Collariella sp. IMI 366227]